MNKQAIIAVLATLFFAICMPNSTMAKKIMYKHHQYKGAVNKENIPQGKGVIEISGFVIKGMFDGTSISNASFQKDHLYYQGGITFNESNSITLKAGGKLTRYYYEGIGIYTSSVEKELYVYSTELALPQYRKSVTETLSNDLEIDNDYLLNDVVKVPTTVEMKGVPLELWPPKKVQHEIIIPKKKFKLNNKESDIYIYVLTEKMKSGKVLVRNYKDEEGRIWDYLYEPKGDYDSKEKIEYKVVFPDGTYCSSATSGERVKP